MITGLAFSVPKKKMTNADFEKIVDTTDEWITERTGMKVRYIGEEGQVTSDICTEAAQKAIAEAGISPLDIDIIILGTITGDVGFPATACFVQDKLGAENAAAFDISAACSGFLYGLTIADAFISTGMYKNILVMGGEMLSRIIDYTDRRTCVLFGDGAGAAIVQPSDGNRGIIKSIIRSDGRLAELLIRPGCGSKYPASQEMIDKKLHFLQMAGQEVFKAAVKSMGDVAVDILEQTQLTSEELALLVPHQANHRIISALAKRIKMPMEKVFINVERYGNTSAATIPIAMTEARDEGKLKRDDYCLLVSFGGGFTVGAVLLKY
ncbi:ketoacyl-ACP synthase III [candidate division KSB1 bacterium]|nr:ketoacyl-ACP synthase III [candidate division KSB1 bacterium]